MATESRVRVAGAVNGRFGGLEPESLIRAFRVMYTSRRLDDREILLKRQNRIFFQISGAGHEAIRRRRHGARTGQDWFYPYYRDRALCLTLGVTPSRCCCRPWVRLRTLPPAAARCRRTGASPQLHIVSSVVAHRHAVPSGRRMRRGAAAISTRRPEDDHAACSGEGATSEGEFWEAMNAACLEHLPVIFLVEDNGYAISVPVEKQTAGGNIARWSPASRTCSSRKWTAAISSLPIGPCARPRAYCREGRGPALVHAHLHPALFALAFR